VAFTYPEPKHIGEHLGVLRCPLKFSAPTHRISFAASDTERNFTAANRDLALGNDQILDKMLKGLGKSDLVSKVKQAIVEHLPSGTPTEELIARIRKNPHALGYLNGIPVGCARTNELTDHVAVIGA